MTEYPIGVESRFVVLALVVFVAIISSFSFVYGQERVSNAYFSIKIPDTWTYIEYSNTAGYLIIMAPVEVLLKNNTNNDRTPEQKIQESGVYSSFFQDTTYYIKNSPLEAYVEYKIGQQKDYFTVSSKDNATIGKEKAVRIFSEGINESTNIKKVEYLLFHDKDPFLLHYNANVSDFDKYLPEFEAMVKSFMFENN